MGLGVWQAVGRAHRHQAQAQRVLRPTQGGDVQGGDPSEWRHRREAAAEDGLEQGTGELLVIKTLYVFVQHYNIAGAGQGG